MTRNKHEEIELRRNQNTLIITGYGIIAFGVWTLVKTLGMLVFQRDEILSDLIDGLKKVEVDITDIPDSVLFGGFLVVISLIFMVDILFRVFVGRSAIKESRDKKRGVLYILVLIIMILRSLNTVFEILMMRIVGTVPVRLFHIATEASLSTMIVEITSMVLMIEMVIAAIRVKRLRKQLKEAEE